MTERVNNDVPEPNNGSRSKLGQSKPSKSTKAGSRTKRQAASPTVPTVTPRTGPGEATATGSKPNNASPSNPRANRAPKPPESETSEPEKRTGTRSKNKPQTQPIVPLQPKTLKSSTERSQTSTNGKVANAKSKKSAQLNGAHHVESHNALPPSHAAAQQPTAHNSETAAIPAEPLKLTTSTSDDFKLTELDIDPFLIDPFLYGRMRTRPWGTPLAAVVAGATGTLTVVLLTALAGTFWPTVGQPPAWDVARAFVLRAPLDLQSLPLLADPPSLILLLTIVTSFVLVYDLFLHVQRLHGELRRNHCIAYSEEGKELLKEAVDDLNRRFNRVGKFAPYAYIVCLLLASGSAFMLKGNLFQFLGVNGLYANWWASLQPFQPASLIWIAIGGTGLYVVYVEAVLGINYVNFAKRCGNDFQFRANPTNPDGAYGWRQLQAVVTNLQAGVVLTGLSSWAMSYFLTSAIGPNLTAIIVLGFVGVVIYVFFSVNAHWRRQVRRDKWTRINENYEKFKTPIDPDDPTNSLAQIAMHERLKLIWAIPDSPVRRKWLFAAAVPILTSCIGLGTQIFRFYNK